MLLGPLGPVMQTANQYKIRHTGGLVETVGEEEYRELLAIGAQITLLVKTEIPIAQEVKPHAFEYEFVGCSGVMPFPIAPSIQLIRE